MGFPNKFNFKKRFPYKHEEVVFCYKLLKHCDLAIPSVERAIMPCDAYRYDADMTPIMTHYCKWHQGLCTMTVMGL